MTGEPSASSSRVHPIGCNCRECKPERARLLLACLISATVTGCVILALLLRRL